MNALKSDIEAEILLRQELANIYILNGQKIYLIVRNLGTLGALVSFLSIFFGYSSAIIVFVLFFVMIGIWVQDVINYSGVGLGELILIGELRKLQEEVLVFEQQSNRDVPTFISEMRKKIEVVGQDGIPIEQIRNIMKKKN